MFVCVCVSILKSSATWLVVTRITRDDASGNPVSLSVIQLPEALSDERRPTNSTFPLVFLWVCFLALGIVEEWADLVG